jgi:hypothetical protein
MRSHDSSGGRLGLRREYSRENVEGGLSSQRKKISRLESLKLELLEAHLWEMRRKRDDAPFVRWEDT